MKMSIFFSIVLHIIILLSFGLYITRCDSQSRRIYDEIDVEKPSNFEKDNKFIVPIPKKRGGEVMYKVKHKDSVEKISAIFKIRTYQLRDKNNVEGRELDLSYGAAKALKAVDRGIISVRIQPLG